MTHLARLALLVIALTFSRGAFSQVALNLTPGWNLLGNGSAAPIDVAATFADASKIATVWTWSKVGSKWAFYAPSMSSADLSSYAQSKGYGVLTSIAAKEGFWVNASMAVALTGPVANGVALVEGDLQQGWNLTASADNKSPSQLNQSLSASLSAAGKAIVTAWAWDASNANWKFYAPSLEAQGGTALAGYVTSKGYLPFSSVLSAVDGFWLNIGAANPAPVNPIGRYRLATRGLWVQIERRGWASEFWPGQVMQKFNDFDSMLGRTVSAEASLQLDAMRAMGINTITIELRSADLVGGYVFPTCGINSVLGFQWPQPTTTELSNLAAYFDLAQSKGMKVQLMLNNTHMEDRANSQTWLGAILGAVKTHAALDVVAFGGDVRLIDTNADGVPDSCGGQAEAPLWMGPGTVWGQYVQWAIGYGIALGIPASKLSAEAIVGDIFTESEPGNRFATDGHLWAPIRTLKAIFDNLGVPHNQRTYVISLYQHTKCSTARGLPCTDTDPHTWANQTLQNIYATIGTGNGARVVAAEMGALPPISSAWPAERALESLVALLEQYGVDGGSYWRWVSTDNAAEADPALVGEPVKRRGTAFNYNPVQKEVLDMGGFHLRSIANPSFENGSAAPSNWTISGTGSGARYFLAGEAGHPVVPTRGSYALRLTTGSAVTDAVSATGDAIAVSPNTTYTTTANLRFQWSGDPLANMANIARPQIYVTVHYYDAGGIPSAIRGQDTFRFYQENATAGFGTFPLIYTTPSDASTLKLEFGAMRNGLPQPITFDVDNVR